ncbi:MAG: hypothetical protein M0Z50_13940 [Planctomycetia bacterium]|jgi:hypothetical protein|nr:hypothetical protein [Planctomycetia bacterium]
MMNNEQRTTSGTDIPVCGKIELAAQAARRDNLYNLWMMNNDPRSMIHDQWPIVMVPHQFPFIRGYTASFRSDHA